METVIATESVPACPACGGPQEGVRHARLVDRLFGAPGEWTMARCAGCRSLFLNPRPAPADIHKIYATYSTHQKGKLLGTDSQAARKGTDPGAGGWQSALLRKRLGYPSAASGALRATVARVLNPARTESVLSGVMFLPYLKGGRLLDVGCGGGAFIMKMNGLGWDCEGLELDENSVRVAREAGLNVAAGQLADQRFPDDRFDAITVKHVIEHVYDPSAMLSECRRILKPGGRLVIITPNPASLGHARFDADWRGLEPPRHLVLLTRPALEKLARDAGLRILSSRTSSRTAGIIWRESHRIRSGAVPGGVRGKWGAKAFSLEQRVRLFLQPDVGEENILEASK